MNPHFLNKRLIIVLGYTGLVPFVLLTLGCWVVSPDWLGEFIRGQMAYGVAALSFLGGFIGARWYCALTCRRSAPKGR